MNYGVSNILAHPSMIQPAYFLTACHCLSCGYRWEEKFTPTDIRTV